MTPTLPDDDDARRLLGAALARISLFSDAPSAPLARRIVEDLDELAVHPGCDDALRRTCGTLRAQWAARCLRLELQAAADAAEATGAAGPAGAPDALRVLH